MKKISLLGFFFIIPFYFGCLKGHISNDYSNDLKLDEDGFQKAMLLDPQFQYNVINFIRDSSKIKFDDFSNMYVHIFTYPKIDALHLEKQFEGNVKKDLSFEMSLKTNVSKKISVERWLFSDDNLSRNFDDIFNIFDYSFKFCNYQCTVQTILNGKYVYFIHMDKYDKNDEIDISYACFTLKKTLFNYSKKRVGTAVIDSDLNIQYK